jgi:uroporphyrinogen III methyltransferase/synthase
MSLKGRTILVTRAAGQADDLVHALERLGGKAVVFSTIEILPPASWEACDKALDGLYMYDGLLFTSRNGAEGFLGRASERQIDPKALRAKKIFVVGAKTKEAVEHHGYSVTAMPERFTAADLSKAIDQEDLKGKAFLFPRGNLGSDILPDTLKLMGASVDSIQVYRTVPATSGDKLRTMILAGGIDVVTFTSPSTFSNFCSLFSRTELFELVRHTKIAVIGPVTERAVEEAGLEADIVAPSSTVESLVEAIAARYAA